MSERGAAVGAGGRVAYLDCSTGVSGDKFLGALLDVGEATGKFTADDLRAIVRSLAPEARVDVERVSSHGVSAVGMLVRADVDSPHRRWADIEALLTGAGSLPEPVRAAALRTFEALAVAEGRVHGVAPADVHFHEVGAIDSIADIVGACAGVHALGIGDITASAVALGSGTVETSHGTLPVPAPATAMLLADVPVLGGNIAGELTTPTGAALLKGLAVGFGAVPAMLIEHMGFGAGTRDLGVPNVCQLLVGTATVVGDAVPTSPLEPVVLLETNIDHISAEELAFAAEELRAGGALDVWQTPIVMKKGRSAVMLSVLVAPTDADGLAERIVALTGSLGVRRSLLERTCAAREIREMATPWGRARVKLGAGRVRPEHDDVARIAREQGLAYDAVAREIERLAKEPDALDDR